MHVYDPSKRPLHLNREKWTKNFRFDHLDEVGLALTQEVDREKIPNFMEEIYSRFWQLGLLDYAGSQCVLMSAVLRRILRLHGYNAFIRQYVLFWERPDRGYSVSVGNPNDDSPEGQLDAHVAVACEGFILDFSQTQMINQYGYSNPRAFIGLDDSKFHNDYQSFGDYGVACWTPARPANPIIKHWQFQQREEEIRIVKDYFKRYDFGK